MSTSNGPIGFGNPANLIAPDLTVQQAQIQRQQDLIDALRQQSMQQVDGGRGAISWTQGLAKVADALASRSMQKRNDQRAVTLNQAIAQRMRPMFGARGEPGGITGEAPPASNGTFSGPPTLDPKGGDPASMPVSPAMSPAPPSPAQTAPPQSSPAAGPSSPMAGPASRGPWSLSGDPNQDMSDYMLNPDKYGEAVISSHAPIDISKQLMQAGIDPNSTLGHQILQANLAKQNYIAPVTARGNSWSISPDGKRTYNPGLPEGSEPVFDGSGNVAGVKMIDGTVQAISAVSGAKAGADASAKAPYELVTVVDPKSGASYQVPKSTITGGGTPGSAPGGGSPRGGLNDFYGRPSGGAPRGNQSGLGPGGQSAATTAGTNSANGFNAALSAGEQAKNSIHTIDNMLTAANGLQTGTGAGAISEAKSGWNVIAPKSMQFDTRDIAKFDELKKNAATLGEQLSNGAGGGTDARLHNALNSLPNANYSPAAIQEVGTNLKALQSAALARSQAAARYMQQNGPDSYPAFQSAWQKSYNPDLFYHLQKGGPAAVAAWTKGMGATTKTQVLEQYRALKAMGAF